MATRYRLTSSTTAPDVSPTVQTYTHGAPATIRRKLLTSDSSTLTTTAYTPDAADHTVAGDALHGQFVGDQMASGITFTNGDTIKFAIQCLEDNAGNNLQVQLYVRIVDSSGTSEQRIVRTKVLEGTEIATSLTNRFLSTTQDGANYTTVVGDRLVVEFSVSGTPVATGGTQGHNAQLRWGGGGAGGDLGENDTDTGTTLNPWIEFVPNITAPGAISGTAALTFGEGSSTLTGSGALAGSAVLVLDGSAYLYFVNPAIPALPGAFDPELVPLAWPDSHVALPAAWYDYGLFEDVFVDVVVPGAIEGTAALAFGAGSSTLTGTGALAGLSAMLFGAGSSTLTGVGALAGVTTVIIGGSATLAGTGALAGSAALVLDATGTITGSSPPPPPPGSGLGWSVGPSILVGR